MITTCSIGLLGMTAPSRLVTSPQFRGECAPSGRRSPANSWKLHRALTEMRAACLVEGRRAARARRSPLVVSPRPRGGGADASDRRLRAREAARTHCRYDGEIAAPEPPA